MNNEKEEIKLLKLEDIKDVNLKYAKIKINYEKYKNDFGFDKESKRIIFIRKNFLNKINKITQHYKYNILRDKMYYDFEKEIMVFKVRPKL